MPEPERSQTYTSTLLDRYRDLVLQTDQLRHQPKKANRLFDERHGVAKALRGSDAGKVALESLFTDDDEAVRLAAASDSLWWNCPEGVSVLEELQRGRTLLAFTAKYVLREYRAGKLDLDW